MEWETAVQDLVHIISDINILICRELREITGSDSGAIGSNLKFGSDLPSDNTFESDSSE